VRLTRGEVDAAVRRRTARSLEGLARPLAPRSAWDDLVLPADRKEMLAEICRHARHRERVLGAWGFRRGLAAGRGQVALFAGASGTGKTLAAGLIAGRLGVDAYQIDLSAVVSKYIGETEKHLARLFDAAEAAGALLFFDEADALFGKRSEVRDAHDRFANIETSYLLQRLDAYDGVIVLASNFRRNMDEAFVRRMQFVVDFPLPEAAQRRQIWARVLPPELPREPGLDVTPLADRFALAGGNIRNIAVAAAFLAAEEDRPLAMRDLVAATRRELQKIGKVVDPGHFAGL
jgi:SpoVK/Ycf46/Vps4 family AAA+-type ATPase